MVEFVGEIAEQRDLSGNENLTTLVDSFIEKKALIGEEPLLPKMEEHFRETITKEHDETKRVVQNLINEVVFPSQEKDITNALRHLMVEYICKEFGMKYDRISPELFELERTISYRVHENRTENVAIPLFASVDFGGGIWKLEKEVNDGNTYNTYKIKLDSKVPPITKEVKEKAKQAIIDYMEIYSKALREPFISDVALGHLDFINPLLDLKTYWIPSPSELNIEVEKIEKDPLLIANIYNKPYLIAKWDVLGEEPYQHYLMEFTERKAGK